MPVRFEQCDLFHQRQTSIHSVVDTYVFVTQLRNVSKPKRLPLAVAAAEGKTFSVKRGGEWIEGEEKDQYETRKRHRVHENRGPELRLLYLLASVSRHLPTRAAVRRTID